MPKRPASAPALAPRAWCPCSSSWRLLASVGERPGLEVGLDPEPDARQASGFEHEEQHDEQTEDGLVEREHADEAVAARVGGDAGENAGVLVDQGRQRADEHGAED